MIPYLKHGWASSPKQLAIALVFTVGFAVLARVLRGVNLSGTMAGGFTCFLLFVGAGPAGFCALAALFALTWASTRFGHRRKLALGLAERREGRNAFQVLGNLSVAASASLIFDISGNRIWLIALIAALAEAATDTVASEIGQRQGEPARMITTCKKVPSGTDGGITIFGSVAGLAAGLLIAVIAVLGGMLTQAQLWIPVATGFGGMLVDSLLGATLQRRGWMSNQMVNFFSTLAAASAAYAIACLIQGQG